METVTKILIKKRPLSTYVAILILLLLIKMISVIANQACDRWDLTATPLCALQVQQVQSVIDGVNLLIEMEKALEKRKSIDRLIAQAKGGKGGFFWLNENIPAHPNVVTPPIVKQVEQCEGTCCCCDKYLCQLNYTI